MNDATTTDAPLVRERHDHVVLLRLNRPEARNALDVDLISRLVDAVAEAEADDEVRAVVLTGTGDRAFCAGMDLRSTAAGDGPQGGTAHVLAELGRIMAGQVAVPIVGAANGTAVGGGLELLLGCDVIVAAAHVEFGLPEVQRGMYPGGNGTAITRRVPYAVAMEMLLTGERITASRAYEVGLVNAVVEPDDLLPTARARAERISRNAPLAVAAVKELGHLAVTDVDGWAERRAHWQGVVFTSDDAREGAAAFFEKRDPVWTGR